jgi:hypothetical protein
METQLTTALDQLHHALEQLRDGSLQTRDFCHQARAQEVLLGALPEKYQTVWLGLIDRMESSALFTEESCSFSQTELIDSLFIWLDKAQRLLEA